jgi:hypothetical protein
MNEYMSGMAGPAQSLSTDILPTTPFALKFSILLEFSKYFYAN